MKPKLLITLGCSWTEGAGCKKPHFSGWPRNVGKELGFDRVINLAKGGSSNSGQAKKFYDFINNQNFDKYDVLVIFLMTEPTRISFYINGRIHEYRTETNSKIEEEYVKQINLRIDPILEQIFFIQSIDTMCTLKGFDFIITSWSPTYPLFYEMYPKKDIHLNKFPKILKPGEPNSYDNTHHPNEKGQDWIKNEIIQGINENHSKWKSNTFNEDVIYDFLGSSYTFKSRQFKNLF